MKREATNSGLTNYHAFMQERRKKYLAEMNKVLPGLIARKLSINGIREWLSNYGYKTVTGKELTPMAVWKLLDDLGLKTYYSTFDKEEECA